MILWMVGAAWGGGFELSQLDAVAAGTGGAGVARVSAASAWHNPAALTDGTLRAGVGLTAARSQISAESLEGADGEPWSGESIPGWSLPPYAYGSVGRGSFTASVSVNLPFAGGIQWAEGWAQRYDIISSSPQFLRIAPAVAWRQGPVSVSAGPHVEVGSLSVVRATNHVSEDGRVELLLRGSGVGLDLGLFLDLEPVDVGLSYKSRTRLALEGEADFDVPGPFAATYPDQTVSADWTLPDRLVLGVLWDAGPVQIAADAGLTLWSVNDALTFDFEEDATPDTVQDNRWRNSLALRAGPEWTSSVGVIVRAGAYVDGITGAPPPAETLSPSSPDGTRVGVTAGAGVPIGPVQLDLFGEGLRILERDSSGDDAPLARYSGRAVLAGASVSVVR